MLPNKTSRFSYYTHVCLVFVLLSIFSCTEREEPCVTCLETTDSTFTATKFRVSFASDDKAEVVSEHWESVTSTTFDVCNHNILADIEIGKIIVASGEYKRTCNDRAAVEFTDFEIAGVCIAMPQIASDDAELSNTWRVAYIQTQDTILYPPCEGTSFITINTFGSLIEGSVSMNSFSANYELEPNSFIFSENMMVTLALGTKNQMYFENIFFEVVRRNSVLNYEIEKNFLTLTNPENGSMIKLFID